MKENYTRKEVIDIIEKIEMYYQGWDDNADIDVYKTVFEPNAFYKCVEMTKDLFGFISDNEDPF